jgi:hypothetical protein
VTSSIAINAVEVSVEVVNSGMVYKCMVLGSNLCLFGLINGGVVHGRGFQSLNFWGQWWCSA